MTSRNKFGMPERNGYPAVRQDSTSTWILDIPCWLLDIQKGGEVGENRRVPKSFVCPWITGVKILEKLYLLWLRLKLQQPDYSSIKFNFPHQAEIGREGIGGEKKTQIWMKHVQLIAIHLQIMDVSFF